MSAYTRIASLKTPGAFRAHTASLGLTLECEEHIETAPSSPLAAPLDADGFRLGNRFVIHPMEGWDGEPDGRPSELTRRRWRNFGVSGAKWIWGGEAMAVVHDGRANPNQVRIDASTRDSLAVMLDELLEAHRAAVGSTNDLLVGFQLTHSGRFCKPNRTDRLEPKIAYHHPLLDRKFGIAPDDPVMSDDELRLLIERFVEAARIAESCGAQFVDVKHCHGYLGHELLSAHTRRGPFGGPLENRMRFLREIVSGVRAATHLKIGVRLSAFDVVPYKPDPSKSVGTKLGPGVPEDYSGCLPYQYGFGVDRERPEAYDLSETVKLLEAMEAMEIRLINISAGSPYYNPHIQRPALFPPSDGYQPPEDPLIGCARQIEATAELKRRFPGLVIVGTAYSYLQEYLPHVAQWVVRSGRADAVGLGRIVLSYPELPADVLGAGKLTTNKLCRTFSDCTTAPRNGLVSGCFPLDPFYKALPAAVDLKRAKAAMR